MELRDLVGTHQLEGFERTYKRNPTHYYPDEAEVIRIKLDGVVYEVWINQSDGYRSYLEELTVSGSIMEFPYDEPQSVEIRHLDYDPDDRFVKWDVIEVINPRTQAVILELGTKRWDDYYPIAICNWIPEAMEINRYR